MNTSKSLTDILATYRKRILLEDDGMADIEAEQAIVEAVEGLLDNAKTATTQGGVHMVATYELRQTIKEWQ